MANGFNKFAAISEDEKHALSTAGGFPFKTDEIVPVRQETDLFEEKAGSLSSVGQQPENSGTCILCGLRIQLGQDDFEERRSKNHDGYDRWHVACLRRPENALERMYRTSLDVATKDNNQLRAERGLLQVRLDYKDAAVVKMQQIQEAELRDLRFERDRLYNHPLMRFVRWLKDWDWMAGRE